jgi:hypothetical protein
MELLRDHRPWLMVADVDLAEGRAPALIADARAILPELRVSLISPAARNRPSTPDAGAWPDVERTRPFPTSVRRGRAVGRVGYSSSPRWFDRCRLSIE